VALALAIAFAAYFLVYRPLQLRWGATGEEVARAMPGDEVQQHPIFNATRAVTIDARPEDVWPWLIQNGYKRAAGTASTCSTTPASRAPAGSCPNCRA